MKNHMAKKGLGFTYVGVSETGGPRDTRITGETRGLSLAVCKDF